MESQPEMNSRMQEQNKMRKLWAVLLAAAIVPAANAAYKCTDPKGVTHIGDTPPEACATVVMYEMQPNGTIIRKIDPTPTPQQLKALQEEQERKKEADRAAAEQKRKDLALLSSYSSEREFDVVRDRNVEPLTGRIRSNDERIKAVEKRIREVEDEMEFYKAGKSTKAARSREAPPVLVEVLARAKTEKATLEKANVGYAKEIEEVKGKFDADKRRWLTLKGAAAPAPVSAVPAAPAPAPTTARTEPQKTRY
jgi:hypothetical protein